MKEKPNKLVKISVRNAKENSASSLLLLLLLLDGAKPVATPPADKMKQMQATQKMLVKDVTNENFPW